MISKLAIPHLPMKMTSAKVIKTLVTNSVNSVLLKTKCFLWISEATRRLVIRLTNEYVSHFKKASISLPSQTRQIRVNLLM